MRARANVDTGRSYIDVTEYLKFERKLAGTVSMIMPNAYEFIHYAHRLSKNSVYEYYFLAVNTAQSLIGF